jgi:hypothetical protein
MKLQMKPELVSFSNFLFPEYMILKKKFAPPLTHKNITHKKKLSKDTITLFLPHVFFVVVGFLFDVVLSGDKKPATRNQQE